MTDVDYDKRANLTGFGKMESGAYQESLNAGDRTVVFVGTCVH
jgi:hypothetical protein